jgi:hypothetical protein
MDEMADDPREDPEAIVNAFLQHKKPGTNAGVFHPACHFALSAASRSEKRCIVQPTSCRSARVDQRIQ